MITVNKNDLISIGFPKSTAQNIIKQAKVELVKEGFTLYLNKRIGSVPKKSVDKIVGFEIGKFND